MNVDMSIIMWYKQRDAAPFFAVKIISAVIYLREC